MWALRHFPHLPPRCAHFNSNPPRNRGGLLLAAVVGFEPTHGCPSRGFQDRSLNRLSTLPYGRAKGPRRPRGALRSNCSEYSAKNDLRIRIISRSFPGITLFFCGHYIRKKRRSPKPSTLASIRFMKIQARNSAISGTRTELRSQAPAARRDRSRSARPFPVRADTGRSPTGTRTKRPRSSSTRLTGSPRTTKRSPRRHGHAGLHHRRLRHRSLHLSVGAV